MKQKHMHTVSRKRKSIHNSSLLARSLNMTHSSLSDVQKVLRLVGSSLTSLFSTNTAISETRRKCYKISSVKGYISQRYIEAHYVNNLDRQSIYALFLTLMLLLLQGP